MSKYLFIESDDDVDFGKTTFLENFKGDLTKLWDDIYSNIDHRMNFTLVLGQGEDQEELEYQLVADNLDDHTFESMADLIDYETDKARGWIKID